MKKRPKWELEIIGADGSRRRYECARSEAEETIYSYRKDAKALRVKFHKMGDECAWRSNTGTIIRVYLYGQPAIGSGLHKADKAYRQAIRQEKSRIARADRELRDNSIPESARSKRA